MTAPAVPTAKGPYVTTRRVGNVLYLSGQGSIDVVTGDAVLDDIQSQTARTLDNVRRLLDAEGFALGDLVQVTCYLRDIDDWSSMNEAFSAYFGDDDLPTRTAIAAAALPFGLGVEMTCIAHRSTEVQTWYRWPSSPTASRSVSSVSRPSSTTSMFATS